MDKSKQRAARRMHDQHSLEEAELRRAQQHTAGDSHRPVQAVPPHGERPATSQDTGTIRDQYEEALQREVNAWRRVQSLPGQEGFAEEAWEDWRDAVEAREKATRLLINHAMEMASRPA